MGLNDLTLEKLIGEINGYKDKLRTIHEEYGRASQDLQDRINVLGYTLNEHLRETKDKISNTPQRLLNLEMKYVTGEVNETEYRGQREEFKALLDRNLRGIDEVKSMIAVLQQIEVKPLAPAEFKQPTVSSVPRAIGEEWGRGAFSQEKSFQLPQSIRQTLAPIPTGLRFASDRLEPESTASQGSAPASSPSPPQQSNGNPWTNQETQPSNASTLWTPTVAEETAEVADTDSSLIVTPEPLASETLSVESSADETVATVPTVDIAETTGSDDALMVKVVDDVPLVDASAAVATTEPSALPSTVTGNEPTVSLPSPDLAQVSLTPPTQFYQVVCPKCGANVPKPAKVWELKGGKSRKNVLIGLFQCQDCRVKFREALTREII